MEASTTTLSDIQNNFSLNLDNVDVIGSVMNDADEVFGWIQRGQKSVTLAALDHEENRNTEKVNALDADFRKLLDLQRKVTNQKLALSTLQTRISQGERITDPIAPFEAIQLDLSKRQDTQEAKYLTNDKYVSFRQNIWTINHPDELMPNLVDEGDDDIVMGSTKISLKCPLTTTWFEDPVTNSSCKHTFSRNAIESMLPGRNVQVECPIPGCSKYLSRQSLQPDEIMADRVRRARAREQETVSNTQFFDVE